MIVAIDFSINSPGICVFTNDKISFGSVIKEGVASSDFMSYLQQLHVEYEILPKYKATGISSIDEQGYTSDAIKTAEAIAKLIKKINGGLGDRAKNILIFEGFSFGSTGNRLAQISGYQFITRFRLLSELFNVENLYVYPPQSIKSIAGAAKKGAGKIGMIQRFIEHEEKLPNLSNNLFYNEVIKNEDSNLRKKATKRKPIGDFQKPTDDIIDAYWVLYTYIKKCNIESI